MGIFMTDTETWENQKLINWDVLDEEDDKLEGTFLEWPLLLISPGVICIALPLCVEGE